MKKIIVLSLLFTGGILLFPHAHETRADDASPFGDYSKYTQNEGYGEKRPVTTKEGAHERFSKYFADKDVTIGKITERDLFFEAEIRDKKNKLIDKVIVDKRTGRIRSMY